MLDKRIVFARFDLADGYWSLWVMNDDGGELTRLTRGSDANQPAPSPSGKLVAFIRDSDVWVIDVATGALTNLTATAEGFEETPAWSPSGKQIAFGRGDLTGDTDLFVMNADGTAVTPLTNTSGYLEIIPKWSPDSKRIAFAANYATTFGIWTLAIDGTARNHLSQTHTPATDEVAGAWAR